ncbi:MAG: peptidase M13 [Bifidobacteriaceae bacterium]|jgi:putative endopeptidase|nr:peptidase M13 [Bifidobacteriaceae bacterium]
MASTGIDRRWQDSAIRPQDDLYRHVNGLWLDTYEIPADRATDGAFRELFDESEHQVRDIIEQCAEQAARGTAKGDAATIGALYAAFMDTAAIEAAGAAPIRPDLVPILSAVSRDDLAHVLGALERSGVGGLVGLWVDTDPDNPTRYAINVAQGGIGLPDEAYYREDKFESVRAAYLEHIADMFTLACGDTLPVAPGDAARVVFDFEAALAGAHWDAVASRDELRTHNPMTMAALAERAPDFAWQRWIDGLGGPGGALANVIVRQPSFIEQMASLWSETPLETLQQWAAWRVVSARAGLLCDPIVEKNFEFWGPVITGATELRERWKRAVSLVEGIMGEAVGQLYVERHFPVEHKEQVAKIVQNLLDAYRASISELAWMGPDTRAKALTKLDKITLKIGYPERWRDYSALKVAPNDPVAAARAAAAFELDRELTKSLGPVDRTEWFMSPQTVNAYYNPGMNEIVFPAAILRPPFFNAGADDAANYGGIGAVIGHEIGHAFDDQGSRFDGDGRLADWWTADDRAEFDRRTSALIAQYDAYVPRQLAAESNPPHVNGALTIGENIGDLGGLAIAWDAYTLTLDRADPSAPSQVSPDREVQTSSLGGGASSPGAVQSRIGPTLDGMSAAQRFLWGWAVSWRSKVRDAEQVRRLTIDPHSPAEFRCNGVIRNLDVFHEAFNVRPGDSLWLELDQRVTIW